MRDYKCKFQDIVDDLVMMNVREIIMDDKGILLAVCDALREKGIKVNGV